MKLKKIYVVLYYGLDNEIRPVKAFDLEEDAKEACKIYGNCEIYSHDYEEISLQEK